MKYNKVSKLNKATLKTNNITWLVKLINCTFSTGTRRLEVTFLDNETSLPAFVGSELLASGQLNYVTRLYIQFVPSLPTMSPSLAQILHGQYGLYTNRAFVLSLCNNLSRTFCQRNPIFGGFRSPFGSAFFSRRNDSCQFSFNLSGFYKFCCDGVYCPDCPMELNISTLQQNVTVTPALNMSCTNTPFTAPFKTEKQPGNFTIKVSYN